jgi:hypothetical protein
VYCWASARAPIFGWYIQQRRAQTRNIDPAQPGLVATRPRGGASGSFRGGCPADLSLSLSLSLYHFAGAGAGRGGEPQVRWHQHSSATSFVASTTAFSDAVGAPPRWSSPTRRDPRFASKTLWDVQLVLGRLFSYNRNGSFTLLFLTRLIVLSIAASLHHSGWADFLQLPPAQGLARSQHVFAAWRCVERTRPTHPAWLVRRSELNTLSAHVEAGPGRTGVLALGM